MVKKTLYSERHTNATSSERKSDLEDTIFDIRSDNTNDKSNHRQWNEYYVQDGSLDADETISSSITHLVHFCYSSKLHGPIAVYSVVEPEFRR